MSLNKLTVGLAGLVAVGALGLGAAPIPREDVRPLLQQALKAAQAITDQREKLHTLLRIATLQNETGDHAGALKTCRAALEIARGLPNDRSKVQALVTVAVTQAEAGDRAAGAETLKVARQATDATKDARQQGMSLIELVHAHGLLGDYAGALRTAKESGEHQASALGMFFPMSLR